VPWFSASIAASIDNHLSAPRVTHFVVGFAAGVIWQLLYRRDLTARLSLMAVCVTGFVVGMLVTRSEFQWQDMTTTGLLLVGILLGLIYTEHFQRWRDRTAWRREGARSDGHAGVATGTD
jgi:ABC-type cobalamin transport system permease subunit